MIQGYVTRCHFLQWNSSHTLLVAWTVHIAIFFSWLVYWRLQTSQSMSSISLSAMPQVPSLRRRTALHRYISTKVLLAEGEETPFTEHCRNYENKFQVRHSFATYSMSNSTRHNQKTKAVEQEAFMVKIFTSGGRIK